MPQVNAPRTSRNMYAPIDAMPFCHWPKRKYAMPPAMMATIRMSVGSFACEGGMVSGVPGGGIAPTSPSWLEGVVGREDSTSPRPSRQGRAGPRVECDAQHTAQRGRDRGHGDDAQGALARQAPPRQHQRGAHLVAVGREAVAALAGRGCAPVAGGAV